MKFSIDLMSSPHRRRAVVAQMIGGYINNGIVILQGILLVPFYLHFIGGRMYGLWLASGGVLAWLSFMDMRLASVISQRVASAYGQKEYDRAGSYFINGMLIYTFLGLIFFLAALGLSCLMPGWFNANPDESRILRYCFLLAALATFANVLNDGLRSFAQALQRPLFPSLNLAFCRVLGIGGLIWFLFMDYGLWSIPFGLLLTALIALIVNLFYSSLLFRGLGGGGCLDKVILKEFFLLSPSLFSGTLGQSIVSKVEPTLIAIMLNPELATTFVLTKRAAEMVGMLLQVIFSSFLPSFSHLYAQDQTKAGQILSKAIPLTFITAIVGYAAYVAGNQSFVSLWVEKKIFAGQAVTIMIAIGLIAMSSQLFLFQLLVGTGDVSRPSYLLLAESFLRVLLMTLLLHFFGLIGLPLAMTISCSFFSIVFLKRFSVKVEIDFFRFKKSAILLVASVVLFGVYSWLGYKLPDFETWLGFIVYTAFITLTLTFFLLMLNPDTYAFIMKKMGRNV
jgi:O-antigen/teichoic acid export membrane protein